MVFGYAIRATTVCLIIAGLSGCVSLNNLADVADIVDSLPTDGTLSCKVPTPRAADTGAMFVAAPVSSEIMANTIPISLAQSTVPKTLLAAFRTQVAKSRDVTVAATNEEHRVRFKKVSAEDRKKLELTSGELKDFSDIFARTILDPSTYTGLKHDGTPYDSVSTAGRSGEVQSLDPNRHNLAHVFKIYYFSYIRGDYVDRTGTQLKKPEIKKSIGNDVISAALMIFMDAIADSQVGTPVLKKGGNYYPAETRNEPTAAARKIVKVLDVSNRSDECGITEPEARAIGFISNLAGDRSALLSGLVLQSFAHVHASFVVGGNFAVGDNDTFATLVKTVLEVVSRRAVEEGAYEFFWAYTYKSGVPRAAELGGASFVFAEQRAADDPAVPRFKGVAKFLEDFQ